MFSWYLQENGQNLNYNQTPETYLGFARADRFDNTGGLKENVNYHYTFPLTLSIDHWGLEGFWQVNEDKIVSMGSNAKIGLNFNAQKVFMVLGSNTGKPISVSLVLNGKPLKQLLVDRHALYQLLDFKTAANGLLELSVNQPGLEAYTFTFG